MKRHALLIALFLTCSGISAQEITNIQSFNLGMGGTGVFASVNYDKILCQSETNFLDVSVGIGRVMFGKGTTIPYSISMNFGTERTFFEAGLGGTYWFRPSQDIGLQNNFSWNIMPIIGYKRYSSKYNVIFRVHVSPVYTIKGAYLSDKRVTPMAGMSLGFAF